MKPAWQAPVGSGFSSPLVVDGHVLLFQRNGAEEQLTSYALDSGDPEWTASWPADFEPQINYDEGPRSTPAVSNGIAVCFGAAGDAAGINLATGKKLWHRRLRKELDASDGYFGAGSSPIILDEMTILCTGSTKSAGIVALNIRTGATIWKSTSFEASYASPILFEQEGNQHLLAVMRYNTVLIDPLTGQVLDELKFGSRGPTVNAASPISVNNQFWLSANYGVGTTIFQVAGGNLETITEKSGLLSCHYNTPVAIGSTLFGIDGYEGRGNVSLRAIDTETKNILWQADDFGTAHLLGSGSDLLALQLDGTLLRIDTNSMKYSVLQSTSLARPGHLFRAVPAAHRNSIMVRTNMNNYGAGATLMRVDL